MAARKNRGTKDNGWHQKTKDRIQTSMLINRLTDHALTHEEDPDYKKKFMQPSQVTAALGLIKKTTPDMQAIQHSGDEKNPFVMKDISAKPLEKTGEEWLNTVGRHNPDHSTT